MPVFKDPTFIAILAGQTVVVPKGWSNIGIIPGSGASVTIDTTSVENPNGQTATFTYPFTLGGAGDNRFNEVWGEISITSNAGTTNIIINGEV